MEPGGNPRIAAEVQPEPLERDGVECETRGGAQTQADRRLDLVGDA